jgi:hypothetical protein
MRARCGYSGTKARSLDGETSSGMLIGWRTHARTVLISVQLPLGDIRPFVGEKTGRLLRPRWQDPAYERDFVRSVGVVKGRLRGGVDGWPSEETFCTAEPPLRFAEQLSWLARKNGHPALCSFQPVYRRLLDNGEAVARLELGLANAPRRPPMRFETLLRLVRDVERLPMTVRAAKVPQRVALARAGDLVANDLLLATTATGATPDVAWLRGRKPRIVVEYDDGEVSDPPAHMDAPGFDFDAGIELTHRHGEHASAWFVRARSGARMDIVRNLRLHLLRLHAEREALGVVLAAAHDDLLCADASAEPYRRLDRYLERATGFLNRTSVYGLSVTPLLDLAYEFDELVTPGRRATLLTYLSDVREHVRRAVADVTYRII